MIAWPGAKEVRMCLTGQAGAWDEWVLGMDDDDGGDNGDSCTPLQMDLRPVNHILKMVETVNYMPCIL